MRRRPLGIDPDSVIKRLRGGVPPDEVYHRPLVTVWTALGKGVAWQDAVNSGMARAASTAAMDVQMAARGTFQEVQDADDGIYGYERASSGGCAYCEEVDGAYVKSGDAMPLHPGCGCSLEPLTAPHPRAATLQSGVAVHEHGELGAYLGASDDHFTTESQALG